MEYAWYAVGFVYRVSDHLSVDLGYTRTGAGFLSNLLTLGLADKLTMTVSSITLSTSYKF